MNTRKQEKSGSSSRESVIMKVRKKAGENMPEPFATDLIDGKIYDAEIDRDFMNWYRIVDESGEDYLYPPQLFEIVEE